jgi:iron-sulfur cluster repair protein YtfE (RIC family)
MTFASGERTMPATNTTVADVLGRAHAKLLQDLRQLEEAARTASGQGAVQLHACLARTWSDLAEHFQFEEQNGYMGAVRLREPRLEHAIRQLAEEHRQLTQSLDTLMTNAKAAAHVTDEFCQELHAWVERVRDHEARENQLVQDSFNLDITGED